MENAAQVFARNKDPTRVREATQVLLLGYLRQRVTQGFASADPSQLMTGPRRPDEALSAAFPIVTSATFFGSAIARATRTQALVAVFDQVTTSEQWLAQVHLLFLHKHRMMRKLGQRSKTFGNAFPWEVDPHREPQIPSYWRSVLYALYVKLQPSFSADDRDWVDATAVGLLSDYDGLKWFIASKGVDVPAEFGRLRDDALRPRAPLLPVLRELLAARIEPLLGMRALPLPRAVATFWTQPADTDVFYTSRLTQTEQAEFLPLAEALAEHYVANPDGEWPFGGRWGRPVEHMNRLLTSGVEGWGSRTGANVVVVEHLTTLSLRAEESAANIVDYARLIQDDTASAEIAKALGQSPLFAAKAGGKSDILERRPWFAEAEDVISAARAAMPWLHEELSPDTSNSWVARARGLARYVSEQSWPGLRQFTEIRASTQARDVSAEPSILTVLFATFRTTLFFRRTVGCVVFVTKDRVAWVTCPGQREVPSQVVTALEALPATRLVRAWDSTLNIATTESLEQFNGILALWTAETLFAGFGMGELSHLPAAVGTASASEAMMRFILGEYVRDRSGAFQDRQISSPAFRVNAPADADADADAA